MTTVEILRKAKQWIELEGWEQGAVHFGDVRGPCCALGAILRASFSASATYHSAQRTLVDAIGGRIDVVAWNDTPGRALPEVLQAFDRAIALAEATP